MLAKLGRGLHALCHTSIAMYDPVDGLNERIGRVFNFIANHVPCPLPKMTFFRANSVIYQHFHGNIYKVYSDHDRRSSLNLIVQNVVRIGFLIYQPRWAFRLGAVAIFSRLLSYALSSAVRRSFSAIVENRLHERVVNLNHIELLNISSDLIDELESDDTFEESRDSLNKLVDNFENALKIPKIGTRFDAELVTPAGETFTTLTNRILKNLRDYQKTDAQEQTRFDTTDLRTLLNLLM